MSTEKEIKNDEPYVLPPLDLLVGSKNRGKVDSTEFITRNNNGITVENLCTILKRNDIMKSEAYESGYLQGTTPSYEAYMKLKKSMNK